MEEVLHEVEEELLVVQVEQDVEDELLVEQVEQELEDELLVEQVEQEVVGGEVAGWVVVWPDDVVGGVVIAVDCELELLWDVLPVVP